MVLSDHILFFCRFAIFSFWIKVFTCPAGFSFLVIFFTQNKEGNLGPSPRSATVLEQLLTRTADYYKPSCVSYHAIEGFTVGDAILVVGQTRQNLQWVYGENRDFDARLLEEGWHSTISMNYKLKILAKRGNRSNLKSVLLQRKSQI